MKNALISLAIIFGLSATVITQSGCKNTPLSNLPGQAVQCGSAQVTALASTLINTVEMLVSGVIPGWGAILDGIVTAVGPAAICAVSAAIADLEGGNGSGSGSAGSGVAVGVALDVDLTPIQLENAQNWMKSHNYVVQH